MVLRLAELVFNNTPSKFNKDLTEFLKRNIETIIFRGQLKFKFKIAGPGDLSTLRNKGITRLPAMIVEDKHFISVPTIINELRRRVKSSKTTATPKNDEEVLDEYFKKTMGDIKKDSDGRIMAEELDQEDTEVAERELSSAMQREMDRRNGNEKNEPRGPLRKPPPNPNRDAEMDNDLDTRRPPTITSRPGQRPRNDNLDAPAGDPMAALKSMQQRTGGNNPDDDLMSALLAKMGTGDD